MTEKQEKKNFLAAVTEPSAHQIKLSDVQLASKLNCYTDMTQTLVAQQSIKSTLQKIVGCFNNN